MSGRYGAYVKWGKVNATLPEGQTPETVTREEAIALIDAKAKKRPAKKAAKKPAAKRTAKTKRVPAEVDA